MNETSRRATCECGCGLPVQIARLNDTSKGWVKGKPLRFVKGHNVRVYNSKKETHPRWKGGRHCDKRGYVMVALGKGARQYEHILVAEKVLGRKLKMLGPGDARNEVVHHINGDRGDNKNSNLLICTHSYHVALHIRMRKSEGAR